MESRALDQAKDLPGPLRVSVRGAGTTAALWRNFLGLLLSIWFVRRREDGGLVVITGG